MKEGSLRQIGKITHFFDKINVAVIELDSPVKVGDIIRIRGSTTDLEQPIKEMQVEHKKIERAGKGEAIGMKVKDKVRVNDKVYLI
jgi:putative protease